MEHVNNAILAPKNSLQNSPDSHPSLLLYHITLTMARPLSCVLLMLICTQSFQEKNHFPFYMKSICYSHLLTRLLLKSFTW